MKNKKYHTDGTMAKSNIKIVERVVYGSLTFNVDGFFPLSLPRL
jgi:hypothetical protein